RRLTCHNPLHLGEDKTMPELSPTLQAALAKLKEKQAQAQAQTQAPARRARPRAKPRRISAVKLTPPRRPVAKLNPALIAARKPASRTVSGKWRLEAAILIEHEICCRTCGTHYTVPNKTILYRLTRPGLGASREVWETSERRFPIPTRLPKLRRRMNGQSVAVCPQCFVTEREDDPTLDLFDPLEGRSCIVEVETLPDSFNTKAVEEAQRARAEKVKDIIEELTLEDL